MSGSARISQFRTWIASQMPDSQRGSLAGRSAQTALLKILVVFERGKRPRRRAGHEFRCVGATDLSPAFDKLRRKFCANALRRMSFPASILIALSSASSNQLKWFGAAGSIANEPIPCQNLPQEDAASLIGVTACVTEALRRIEQNFPKDTSRRSVYLDDRTWITKEFATCVDIRHCRAEEMQRLQLTELR